MSSMIRYLTRVSGLVYLFTAASICIICCGTCGRFSEEADETLAGLHAIGLQAELISTENFFLGEAPPHFEERTGAPYKPSWNVEPNIPPQCWIETGYGTQNACKYCHTDYLASHEHGNAFPIGDMQILYNFPTPELNRILWRNIIFPQEIEDRLRSEGIPLPDPEDVNYVRFDNWRPAFSKARGNGNTAWVNTDDLSSDWAFFPALDPDHLYPYRQASPTSGGKHGFIDPEGFVRDASEDYTGWRALNFFPYTIFTPFTGSVSGIYIRLPKAFMSNQGVFDVDVYKRNLELLEAQVKNREVSSQNYYGDASGIALKKGFYPVGTEFAHPLHYVDLAADGKSGMRLEAVAGNTAFDYAFPGTRSKRVKEIRYMYKWKDVDLADIALDEAEEEGFGTIAGKEGQGWVDNAGGWILAAFIEDRQGNLRPQTTEELAQCIGCHGNVGNTVDAVWSFQRKLPGMQGWRDMDYGQYNANRPYLSKLQDYLHEQHGMGEHGYFYYTVVGADLYGVMPAEIKDEIIRYAGSRKLETTLGLTFPVELLFDDEQLKNLGRNERRSILLERQKLMRKYAGDAAYLSYHSDDDAYYIRGSLLYPNKQTMASNIEMYRKIVLDQSYNLGKDVFGTESQHIPFTFRSDGTVMDEDRQRIPAGQVIMSRPYNDEGIGFIPTGIVAVNDAGEPIDDTGQPVGTNWSMAVGHISKGGTFDMMYNPILSDRPFRPAR